MQTHIIRIYGIVQGVGFRPFAVSAAHASHICGSVANKGSYVEITAQGSDRDTAAFKKMLLECPPDRAVILDITDDTADMPPVSGFVIADSTHEQGDIYISPDIAMCAECRRELTDPSDRRFLHPFINCTQCGPRLTILRAMPYDRERTSMVDFPMCGKCAEEYTDRRSRRYDAQPVCCNDCGPHVRIAGTDIKDGQVLPHIRHVIRSGGIAAVKGIGGFHLCCDAKDTNAVRRLRQLKHRPAKPFAVMCRDMETVRRECVTDGYAESLLDGWQKPVLILPRKDGEISPLVSPALPTAGVMLPYSPIHTLLFEYPDGEDFTDCLVMTSANISGAPICRTDEDIADISGCDAILTHDREILIRADDSVAEVFDSKPYMIRRSRGFSPLPLSVRGGRDVIAVGGELKGTFAVGKGGADSCGLIYPSPYVGDMTDVRTADALRDGIRHMASLLEVKPERIVCDRHPMYNSVSLAEELADTCGIPLVKVQHHYAHVLSCMAEHRHASPVIGVSFDGTGYGDDGTIWGGEFLVCDVRTYERAGHITPFTQTGGDSSARECWRNGVSMLSLLEDGGRLCDELGLCDKKTYDTLVRMAERGLNSVTSTSVGRLFDAVSAILGICRENTYEGEAAALLMHSAMRCSKADDVLYTDTSAIVRDIAYRRAQGEDRDLLAYSFHRYLAGYIAETCEVIRERYGIRTAVLTGGVFQNTLLLRLTKDRLTQKCFQVLTHSLIPPNDGGICVGQAYHGMSL
ncbi:MAG: carbamoyltransferase HypF [Oscillospiraceae bacterium]|nr:carbamoyltransferase HypF [Oscillospiraceae bacterium]